MDPLSIITTVLATARFTINFLQNHEKKDAIISDLTRVVQMLCDILQPLQQAQNHSGLNQNVVSVVIDIAETLTSTREHLELLQAKSSPITTLINFLTPGDIVNSLRDDQTRLQGRISLLMLAIQVAAIPGVTPPIVPKTLEYTDSSPGYHEYEKEVGNDEVQSFWSRNFGQDAYVPDSSIPIAIGKWTNEKVDEQFGNALIGAIDSKDIGVSTPRSLARFVKDRSITQASIELRYMTSGRAGSTTSSTLTNAKGPPTLVWIDDNPTNNSLEIRMARRKGIEVVQLPSTSVAKLWIKQNLERLERLDNANKLRFITDNHRWERESWQDQFMNLSAGERILRFLRATGLKSPVLVYTGSSIPSTKYVLKFSRAGSTVSMFVCMAFITELAKGVDESPSTWEGFNNN